MTRSCGSGDEQGRQSGARRRRARIVQAPTTVITVAISMTALLAGGALVAPRGSPAGMVERAIPPAPKCAASSSSCLSVSIVDDIAVAPDSGHLYAVSPGSEEQEVSGIVGWALDQAGNLDYQSPVACIADPAIGARPRGCAIARGWPPSEAEDRAGGTILRSIVISPDGAHVYFATAESLAGGAAITTFARDPASGALEQMPASAGCVVRDVPATPDCGAARGILGVDALAVSPDGRTVYATARGNRTWGLVAFARNLSTGALTQLAGAQGCASSGLRGCARARGLNRPTDVVVAPDGRHVYVASEHGETPGGGIAAFARNPLTGSLAQLPRTRGCISASGSGGCSRDPRIGAREHLAVAPDGQALYSVAIFEAEGPRISPLAADGHVRRSSGAPRFPAEPGDGPKTLSIDKAGRVYAAGGSGALVVYTPTGTPRRLRRVACWSPGGSGRCRKTLRLFAAGFSSAVPAPGGRTIFIGSADGILTAHLAPG